MASPRPLLAGNWKMNGLRASLSEVAGLRDAIAAGRAGKADVLLCVPSTLLMAAAEICAGTGLMIGGQDCDTQPSGASTGDISAEMLKDAGAGAVIVGHSERRANRGETDAVVRAKAEAAARAGLLAVLCVGETRAEHDRGETLQVIGRQLDASVPPSARAAGLAVAYEPVWAIGTGLVPSDGQIADVHAFMRRRLGLSLGGEAGGVRLLYGGSVKPDNAAEVLGINDVDGVLVGGASLRHEDFLRIIAARR